ncbi:MAG: TetR/AcrR family transcriptional regulator [Solibacillus sp.]|uniref:TetR/AcrR family transcriptional regulator n=1 Tax=Solibacillus sp. TaxID=1909654 RepID=UPI0033152CC2
MSNQTKDKILETATRLFYFQGFHGTGLNQIIKESGSPKGSLYHYFPEGKEQLAEEAIVLSKRRIGAVIQHYMNEFEDVGAALNAHILAMADLFDLDNGLEDSYTMMPFGLLAAESAFMNERLRKVCGDTYKYWESIYYTKLIANGFSDEAAVTLSKAVSAMIEGAVTLSLSQRSNESLLNISKVIPALLAQNK